MSSVLEPPTEILEEWRCSVAPPWGVGPYLLVNWWTMEKFSAEQFCNVCANLTRLSAQYGEMKVITPAVLAPLVTSLGGVERKCDEIGLLVSARQFWSAIENIEVFASDDALSGAIHSAQICRLLMIYLQLLPVR